MPLPPCTSLAACACATLVPLLQARRPNHGDPSPLLRPLVRQAVPDEDRALTYDALANGMVLVVSLSALSGFQPASSR